MSCKWIDNTYFQTTEDFPSLPPPMFIVSFKVLIQNQPVSRYKPITEYNVENQLIMHVYF